MELRRFDLIAPWSAQMSQRQKMVTVQSCDGVPEIGSHLELKLTPFSGYDMIEPYDWFLFHMRKSSPLTGHVEFRKNADRPRLFFPHLQIVMVSGNTTWAFGRLYCEVLVLIRSAWLVAKENHAA